METKRKFRAAVIGCGVISYAHLHSLALLDNAEVVALCDVNTSAAEKRKNEFSLDLPLYTDYKEMLDREKPDVVHICTPHHLHAERIIEALSRDINVLSEKPLFFLLNSYTTGLAPSAMKYITDVRLLNTWSGKSEADELGLPVGDGGLALPCGSSVRVTFE